jgi:hypothetical protein
MRVIDKNAPSDLDKFWIELGEMQVTAMVTGRTEEVVIEERADIAEELKAPDAVEAGKAAYVRGIFRVLDRLIVEAGRALENKRAPSSRNYSFVKLALLRQVAATTPPLKFTVVPREARTVTRKTVESYDKDGRISSLIEEKVEV